MIPLTTGQYDADAPEGDKGFSSQYINKKDLIRIGIILVVVGLMGIPVYRLMKENGDRTVCKKNLKGAWQAIGLYAAGNDDRYPPLFDETNDGVPYLQDGLPVTWASTISQQLLAGVTLSCPSADPSEHTHTHGKIIDKSGFKTVTKDQIELSYGMYAPLATRPISDVTNDAQTILVAETANHGAKNTYNPVPFVDSEGNEIPFDGFFMGWNTRNRGFNGQSALDDTESITRLAFYNTANGDFSGENVSARHKEFVFAVFADGSLTKLTPSDALIIKSGNRINQNWSPD